MKSSFLTFLFALMPGAGEMYLEMMKKGAVIMAAFWGIIAVSSFFRLDFLLFAAPIIWFYAFFDTLNSRKLSQEDRIAKDEQFIKGLQKYLHFDWEHSFANPKHKRHLVIGIAAIVIGAYMILRNFLFSWSGYMSYRFPILYDFIDRLPTFAVAVVIIIFGIYLVKGKKHTPEDEIMEYKGADEDE